MARILLCRRGGSEEGDNYRSGRLYERIVAFKLHYTNRGTMTLVAKCPQVPLAELGKVSVASRAFNEALMGVATRSSARRISTLHHCRFRVDLSSLLEARIRSLI